MRRRIVAVLVPLLGVLIIAGEAGADSWVRSVRVKRIWGNVEIDQAKGRGPRGAMAWMPITEGTRIKTLSAGRADVEFEDGSLLRLAPKTDVSFSKLMLLSAGNRASVIELKRGAVGANFRKQKNDSVQLVFAGGAIELSDSAEFVLQVKDAHGKLTVRRGKVKVQQSGEVVVVNKKQTWEFQLLPTKQVAATHPDMQEF